MKMPDLQELPGSGRVQQGLADLQAGRSSVEALWLAAACSFTRPLGVLTSMTVAERLTLERPAATNGPAGPIGCPPVRSKRGCGGGVPIAHL